VKKALINQSIHAQAALKENYTNNGMPLESDERGASSEITCIGWMDG
jgi:hypothetical protein